MRYYHHKHCHCFHKIDVIILFHFINISFRYVQKHISAGICNYFVLRKYIFLKLTAAMINITKPIVMIINPPILFVFQQLTPIKSINPITERYKAEIRTIRNTLTALGTFLFWLAVIVPSRISSNRISNKNSINLLLL